MLKGYCEIRIWKLASFSWHFCLLLIAAHAQCRLNQRYGAAALTLPTKLDGDCQGFPGRQPVKLESGFPSPFLSFSYSRFFFFWSSKHWRHQLKAKKNTERQIAWHGYGYGYYSRSRRTPIVKARRDGDACSRLRWFPIQFQFQFGYEHGHGHGYMGIWVWVFASRLDVLIFSYIDNTFFVIVSVLLLLL